MIQKPLDIAARHVHFVFGLAAAMVVASLAGVVLIDVFNVAGLRDAYAGRQAATGHEVPFFWFHWYLTPVENPLQWVTLGLFVTVCGANGVVARRADDRDGSAMWMLIAVGGALMLMEDALDVRHELRVAVNRLVGEESYGLVSTTVELGYFAAIAAILVWALVRYRHYWSKFVPARHYLIVGYGLYGLAVAGSWLGSAFRDFEPGGHRDLYTFVGDRITSGLFSLDDQARRLFDETSRRLAETDMAPLSFYFVDRVAEESLELLGAAALLAASLAFWNQFRDRQ